MKVRSRWNRRPWWASASRKRPRRALVLHADNGCPMKGSTMLATPQRLGVVAFFGRPSVSDDNPFAEAIFRTMKYPLAAPRNPLPTSRRWTGPTRNWAPIAPFASIERNETRSICAERSIGQLP